MACRIGLRTIRTGSLLAGLTAAAPALSAQGVAVGDGTASPIEQALAIAFILSLPLTLVLIGLSRTR